MCGANAKAASGPAIASHLFADTSAAPFDPAMAQKKMTMAAGVSPHRRVN